MEKKKILILGGAGFLGSHVGDLLTKRGHQVTLFDTFLSPYIQSSQEMIIGSILDESKLNQAVANADIVYHFAGVTDIDIVNNDPLGAIEANVLGTAKVLSACVTSPVERLFFASSVYVYSNYGGVYRITKQACELLIKDYHQTQGLKYTIMQIGSSYGPRAKSTNLVNSLIHQALTAKKITHHGDGEEIRKYIYVKDIARASVKSLAEDHENKTVILLGSESVRIKDLMKMINQTLAADLPVDFLNNTYQNHYKSSPFSQQPNGVFKFDLDQMIPLDQGLHKTISALQAELA